MRITWMISSLLFCILVQVVSTRTKTRFVRVKTNSGTLSARDPKAVKICSQGCRDLLDIEIHCFGFSMDKHDNCTYNTANSDIPHEKGDYFELTHYRKNDVTKQCDEGCSEYTVTDSTTGSTTLSTRRTTATKVTTKVTPKMTTKVTTKKVTPKVTTKVTTKKATTKKVTPKVTTKKATTKKVTPKVTPKVTTKETTKKVTPNVTAKVTTKKATTKKVTPKVTAKKTTKVTTKKMTPKVTAKVTSKKTTIAKVTTKKATTKKVTTKMPTTKPTTKATTKAKTTTTRRQYTFPLVEFQGSLFYFNALNCDHARCNAICSGVNMTMISVHSAEENEFVRSTTCKQYFNTSGPGCHPALSYASICHLGIALDVAAQQWTFTDGTRPNYQNGTFVYTPEKSCVHMRCYGDWNYLGCGEVAKCVCRKNL